MWYTEKQNANKLRYIVLFIIFSALNSFMETSTSIKQWNSVIAYEK